MKRFSITLMLALAPSAALAESASPCMTAVEAEALVQYALPDIIEQVSGTCSASLPSTAFLIRGRADLVARYSQAARPALPVAREAFWKIAGIKPEQAKNFRDESLRDLLRLGIGTAMADKFKPKDCGMIDQIIEQLAPLPPENMAKLIGIAIREGDKRKKKDGSGSSSALRLCDAQEGAR